MSRPILTADAMRAAEQAAIAAGTPETVLMERAGAALAEAAWLVAGAMPALVLCGPGNNGGDGYVAARHLAARGLPVSVAALAEPATEAARSAAGEWSGVVEPLRTGTRPAPLLLDCLFGTGLRNGLDDAVIKQFLRLAGQARLTVACDLPSGVAADDGAILSPVPWNDLTVTFGALKPAHRLASAMHRCGRVVLADIGVGTDGIWHEIGRPALPPLDPEGHKFTRGMIVVVGGAMPGAAALAATAAARAGAGYVRLDAASPVANVPACIVQGLEGALDDPRIGALLIGPGLGPHNGDLLDKTLHAGRPLIVDGDALSILGDPARLHGKDAIVTPHAGEFARLFGSVRGSLPEQALAAARAARAVVVLKGPSTLVAAPDGRLGFAPPAPAWLASAGTGDVLAGIIAAMRARGLPAFEAACAGVWLHGRAAELAGPAMIADDLLPAIARILSE
ncbi:MAG: NAD(P)H-hydrate dehydratase [Sphingomicrobium sp.]|nr:NAD(P)H-hydrate dehydratase [Sphingomonadales bacterium]